MNRYKVVKQLGDGTYGSVWKATHRQSGEEVAIKKARRETGGGARRDHAAVTRPRPLTPSPVPPIR